MITVNSSPLILALADVETLIIENPQQTESKVLRIFDRAKILHDNQAQLVATGSHSLAS